MPEQDAAAGGANRAACLLRAIAGALDCPVATFLGSMPREPDETVELLRLWLTIERQPDRDAVLAFVRSTAARAV